MLSGRNPLIALMAVCIAILFSTALLCLSSSAQDSTELDFIIACNPMQGVSEASYTHVPSRTFRTPGPRAILVGAIRFYQLFISTQDAPACNFVPSCSSFGAESIRRLGVVRGILLTSDRLQRCNSVSISRYQIDHRSGRLVDPVQTYQEILR